METDAKEYDRKYEEQGKRRWKAVLEIWKEIDPTMELAVPRVESRRVEAAVGKRWLQSYIAEWTTTKASQRTLDRFDEQPARNRSVPCSGEFEHTPIGGTIQAFVAELEHPEACVALWCLTVGFAGNAYWSTGERRGRSEHDLFNELFGAGASRLGLPRYSKPWHMNAKYVMPHQYEGKCHPPDPKSFTTFRDAVLHVIDVARTYREGMVLIVFDLEDGPEFSSPRTNKQLIADLLDKLPTCFCCGEAAAHLLCDGSSVCPTCMEEGNDESVKLDYRWHRELAAVQKRMEEEGQ